MAIPRRARSALLANSLLAQALLASVLLIGAAAPARAQRAVDAASDSSFGALVARLSEPGGYFDSDNIITNEASYLKVASQLQKVGTHGGVYVGVGPDQNFSYIALVRPSIAFMLDIRRDNLLEHLLFKSLFALSRNRIEYLCLLLGKPVPSDFERWNGRSAAQLLSYLEAHPTDSALAAATRRRSNERIDRFGVALDARDRAMIDRYRAEFVEDGLDTRYSSLGRNNRYDYPTFGELIAATDRAGRPIGYLADEDAYQFVRGLELADRVVPVVGNVAGDKALRAIGAYAAARHMSVSTFYISNVEQYLITRDGGYDAYVRNVGTLPHDSASVIIRSYFGRFGNTHPLYVAGSASISTSMVEKMDNFLQRNSMGLIRSYADLVFNGFVTP